MNKPNEPSKATPLVEQIAEQFETRLENQGYLGITDNTPPEVTARIRRHVTNEFLAAIDRALSPYTETISNEEMDRIEREHPPAAQPQPPLVEQIADECFDNISSFIPEWRDNLEPKKWIRHFIQAAIEKREAQIMATLAQSNVKAAQPQPRKEIKTGGTMRRVCSVCKAEFLGTGMDNLCSKHQPQRSEQIQQAIDILSMQDNAGKGQTKEELARRNQQALDVLRSGAASGEHKTAICPFCHGSFVVDATHIMELQQGAASGTPTSCSPGRVAGSEPQEPWRYVAIGLRGKDWQVFRGKYHHVGKAASEEDAKFFCMELNAALAAERADYDKLHDKAVHWQDEALAEREKREQAERVAQVCYDLHAALGVKWGDDPYAAINKLKSELLQALATIKHHNATLRVGSCHYIDVNLSALHEHDNKVRKPLVADKERLDWLEHRPSQVKEIFKDWECWPHNVRGAIDAALAQAKENRRDSAT